MGLAGNSYAQLTRATGVIDFNADPAAGDTVTVGGITYTYVASLTAANDVLVGADRDESITHLVAAINGDASESGSGYHADTVANPTAVAEADLVNDEIDLTCAVPGTIGNGITLATSEVDIVIAGSNTTMTGGVGVIEDVIERLVDGGQCNAAVLGVLLDLTSRAD